MSAIVMAGARNSKLVPQEWWYGNKDGSSDIQGLNLLTPDGNLAQIQGEMGLSWEAKIDRLVRESDGTQTNHWQMYRSDNNKTLHSCEQANKPYCVQPTEIMEFMDEVRRDTDGEWLTGLVLKNGKIAVQIRFGEEYQMMSDTIIPNLLMMYDYESLSGQVKACHTTAVCANTVAMGLGEKLGYNLTYNALDARAKEKILEGLKIAAFKGQRYKEVMERASQTPCQLDGADVLSFAMICDDLPLLDRCIAASGKEHLQEILEENRKKPTIKLYEEAGKQARMVYGAVTASSSPGQEQRGDNWYAVSQGLTQYVNNVAGREGETRVDSALLGPRALMVEKSVSLLDRIIDLVG